MRVNENEHKLRQKLNSMLVNRAVSVTTMQGCIATKAPLLRKGNKIKRLNWIREHKNFTTEQWSKVLSSSKEKFEIFEGKRSQEEATEGMHDTTNKTW